MTPETRRTASLVQRALSGHVAIGLLAGAILYLILLSGTIAVVHDRLGSWEQPSAPSVTILSPEATQRAVATAATGGDRKRPDTILITLPTTERPRADITVDARPKRYLYANGAQAGRVATPWTDFVLALHEYLTLPSAIGLAVVGAFGVMMAALTITGIVAHPRIFRDAFMLRPRANRQLAQADWHNRLGVWTLPFALAVALTGAILGLGGLGTDLVARYYHDGNVMRTYAPVFGAQAPVTRQAAPVLDVAAAMRAMSRQFPGVAPTYVTIEHPGTCRDIARIAAATSSTGAA